MTPRPAALCFDLDDTLWPVMPVLLAAEQATAGYVLQSHPGVVARHDTSLPGADELVATMRRWREQVGREHPERQHDLTWLRHEALRRQALAAGHAEAPALRFADAAFEVFFTARHAVQPYADVPDALARLARHFPLYVLSNGNAEPARTVLGVHFRQAWSARSLGIAKPHPRAFLAMAEAVGVEPQQWLHIGDDPQADVAGGRAAGMCTAWIHRGTKAWPEDLERAHHEFEDLTALADVLTAGGDTHAR